MTWLHWQFICCHYNTICYNLWLILNHSKTIYVARHVIYAHVTYAMCTGMLHNMDSYLPPDFDLLQSTLPCFNTVNLYLFLFCLMPGYFTLSNARRFYLSRERPLEVKGHLNVTKV